MARVLILLLLCIAGPVQAREHAEAVREVVDRYMERIAASDWDGMAALLAPDAHYEDRTMAHFDREPVDLHGPEAIVGFWRRSAEGAGSGAIHYDVRRAFVAGPVVVLDTRVRVENDAAAWDMPGFTFTGEMDVITLVEVRDGRVRWHLDAADYASAERQIAELRSAYEAGRSEQP